MAKRKYQKPLKIEMDLEEALKRFGMTDPEELPEHVKRHKRNHPEQDDGVPIAASEKTDENPSDD